MLTLGWSDGSSFVPINHRLLSAADDKNLLCKAANFDGRSLASSVSGTKAREKTGLPSSARTQLSPRKKSSVFMGNAGI